MVEAYILTYSVWGISFGRLFWGAFLLHLLDVALTVFGLSFLGTVELNPFGAYVWERWRVLGLLIPKLAAMLLIYAIYRFGGSAVKQGVCEGLAFMNILYLGLALWNAGVLAYARGHG